MNLANISQLVTLFVTAASAIVAVLQYVWNSRPHYRLLKGVHAYSIGDPKDSLSISIANTGTLKLNIALMGITVNKVDGQGNQFIGAVSFPQKMTYYKSFGPNEVGTLIEFTSQTFAELISYKVNSNFYKIVQHLILNDQSISFYVWTVDYRNRRRPIKVVIDKHTHFYQNLKRHLTTHI